VPSEATCGSSKSSLLSASLSAAGKKYFLSVHPRLQPNIDALSATILGPEGLRTEKTGGAQPTKGSPFCGAIPSSS